MDFDRACLLYMNKKKFTIIIVMIKSFFIFSLLITLSLAMMMIIIHDVKTVACDTVYGFDTPNNNVTTSSSTATSVASSTTATSPIPTSTPTPVANVTIPIIPCMDEATCGSLVNLASATSLQAIGDIVEALPGSMSPQRASNATVYVPSVSIFFPEEISYLGRFFLHGECTVWPTIKDFVQFSNNNTQTNDKEYYSYNMTVSSSRANPDIPFTVDDATAFASKMSFALQNCFSFSLALPVVSNAEMLKQLTKSQKLLGIKIQYGYLESSSAQTALYLDEIFLNLGPKALMTSKECVVKVPRGARFNSELGQLFAEEYSLPRTPAAVSFPFSLTPLPLQLTFSDVSGFPLPATIRVEVNYTGFAFIRGTWSDAENITINFEASDAYLPSAYPSPVNCTIVPEFVPLHFVPPAPAFSVSSNSPFFVALPASMFQSSSPYSIVRIRSDFPEDSVTLSLEQTGAGGYAIGGQVFIKDLPTINVTVVAPDSFDEVSGYVLLNVLYPPTTSTASPSPTTTSQQQSSSSLTTTIITSATSTTEVVPLTTTTTSSTSPTTESPSSNNNNNNSGSTNNTNAGSNENKVKVAVGVTVAVIVVIVLVVVAYFHNQKKSGYSAGYDDASTTGRNNTQYSQEMGYGNTNINSSAGGRYQEV